MSASILDATYWLLARCLSYPHTRLAYRHTFNDVDRDEVRMMLGSNAAELYGFDLDKLQSLADEFGPSPDEVAIPLQDDEFPEKAHTNAFRRV